MKISMLVVFYCTGCHFVLGNSGGKNCPSISDISTTLSFEGVMDGYTDMLSAFDATFGVCGIYFSSSATAIVSSDQGGNGNFCSGYNTGTTSGSTALAFIDDGDSPALINVYYGFDYALSFYYSSINEDLVVSVFDDVEGAGNVLANVTLPRTPLDQSSGADFCDFQLAVITFDGFAFSVNFGGASNRVIFDDVTFGSSVPQIARLTLPPSTEASSPPSKAARKPSKAPAIKASRSPSAASPAPEPSATSLPPSLAPFYHVVRSRPPSGSPSSPPTATPSLSITDTYSQIPTILTPQQYPTSTPTNSTSSTMPSNEQSTYIPAIAPEEQPTLRPTLSPSLHDSPVTSKVFLSAGNPTDVIDRNIFVAFITSGIGFCCLCFWGLFFCYYRHRKENPIPKIVKIKSILNSDRNDTGVLPREGDPFEVATEETCSIREQRSIRSMRLKTASRRIYFDDENNDMLSDC